MSKAYLETAVAAALVGLAPLPAVAQPAWDGCGWHQPHMMGGGSWFAVTFGLLVPLIVLIAVVALAARYAAGASRAADKAHQPTPLDILKERFARGEIDKAEYEERRQVLSE